MIVDVLENGKMDESLPIQVMGSLATLISLPSNIYHKTFMEEYGARIADAIKNRLINSPDKSIRDVRKEQIDSIRRASVEAKTNALAMECPEAAARGLVAAYQKMDYMQREILRQQLMTIR